MPELKLTTPLPEIDTARLRPGLRARPKRLPISAVITRNQDEEKPKP